MQEKTLENEFRLKYYNGELDNIYPSEVSYDKLLAFISSREEKAREEGRKEEQLAWITPTMTQAMLEYNHEEAVKKAKNLIITQYKEELLEKINKLYQDERPVDCIDGETPVETYGYEETHNNALSEVKKLI